MRKQTLRTIGEVVKLEKIFHVVLKWVICALSSQNKVPILFNCEIVNEHIASVMNRVMPEPEMCFCFCLTRFVNWFVESQILSLFILSLVYISVHKTSSHEKFSFFCSVFLRIHPNTKSDFEMVCENGNGIALWR